MNWIISLCLLVLFELIADVFAKNWSTEGKIYFWVASILSYVIANIFWLSSIKNGSGLARGAVLFGVSSAVVGALLGIFLYKENLSLQQIIGISIGIVAIVLIVWGE
jgi:drug/metabolite transporter (DMT)-like permease